MKKKINPHGHSFDAVTRLREKTREKDRFYTYSFNNGDMNPSNPTYVFKTSTVSLNIALYICINLKIILCGKSTAILTVLMVVVMD